MKQCKVGILGATGAVGQEMLKILQEYEIPVEELFCRSMRSPSKSCACWPVPAARVKRSSSTVERS